jgi:hypothetical protein
LIDGLLSCSGKGNKASRSEAQHHMRVKGLLDKKGQSGAMIQIALEFHAFGK